MSATLKPAAQDALAPYRWLWTADEFQRAYDLGAFGFEARLELLEGEIVQKMTQNPPHAYTVQTVTEILRSFFPTGYAIRVQLPLVFAPYNKPEPDIAVVTGSAGDYKSSHPATATLVVEISDTTLALDRTTKASLYARADITEYWIVNLPDRVLEVHRQPAAMTDQPLGYHYRSISRLTETDTIAPSSILTHTISVGDMLP